MNMLSRPFSRTLSLPVPPRRALSLLSNHARAICYPRVAPSPPSCSLTPSRHFSYTPSKPLARTLSVTQPYLNDAARPTSFADPDRPELFYHLFHPPTSISETTPVFALSFISEAPPTVGSCAVVGWLPAAAPAEGEAGLNDFRENTKFLELLHEAVQSALRDGADDIQINAAIQTQQGWMHIHDMRNVPALGRIGDPDDIIASVRVEDGKILAETYQPMPSYRLCTSDGILQLTEGLARRLHETLVQRVKVETKP